MIPLAPQQPPLTSLQMRARRAAADLMEALSVNPPAPPAPAISGQPQVGPGQSQGGPGPPQAGAQPMSGPAPSPLQTMPSMHSPPMEAVLQGPRGMEAQQKPVGFARGGLAVFRGT